MASASGISNIPINLNAFLQINKAGLALADLVPGDILMLDVLEKLPENQFIMNLKGTKITVKSDLPLSAGDKFQVRVQSVQPQIILKPTDAPEQMTDVKPAPGGQGNVRAGALLQVLTKAPDAPGNMARVTAPPMPQLSAGQAVTVTVREKLSGNQYLLDLKGTPITVKTDAPLSAGDKFSVRVQSVQPQMVLQVRDAKEQVPDVQTRANPMPRGVNPALQNSGLTKAPPAAEGLKTSGQPTLQLSQGQALTVTVAEKLPGNQYRVIVKDVSIAATSDIPMKEGDKFQVRVQSLKPQIVLSPTDVPKQMGDAKVNERLVQWRINPDSLSRLMTRSTEFSENLKTVALPANFSGKDADVLIKFLNQIVLSPKTKTNPLFLKDFVAQSGLMLEKNLAALALAKSAAGAVPPSENIKASLLKLSEALNAALKDALKTDAATTARLQNLASFASEALDTLEIRQAVNVVYQQNENGLYLQIPLALGGGVSSGGYFHSSG